MYVCAAILPISYLVGLIFTLKTHAHLLDNSEYENHNEQGPSPLWSKTKCISNLFFLYYFILLLFSFEIYFIYYY